MGKLIINKHIDTIDTVDLLDKFDTDKEYQKGEILICNDPKKPSIYIMDSEGNPKNIGSSMSTSISEDIVIAGLDGQFGAGNYENGQTIPAGTDIYTILQNILCKELYPTGVKSVSASATASMNSLILKLSKTDMVEVGTLVELTQGETNGSSVSKTNSSVTGMTYGYSSENDNTKDSEDSSIVKVCSTSIADNNYEISATISSGFNADSENHPKTTPATKTGTGNASLEATNLGCVIEGSNSIQISATGASYSYSADEISKVYYCSNLGKTDDTHYHNGVSAVSGTTEKPTKTADASVTGSYLYFMGCSENTKYDDFDSDSIRNLKAKSGWVTKDGTTTIIQNGTIEKSNGKSIIIACPSKYELKTINYSNQADMLKNFSSVGKVPVKTGEIYTEYTVYVYPITNNAVVEFTNVTLAKA
jgi:hypothetical protein